MKNVKRKRCEPTAGHSLRRHLRRGAMKKALRKRQERQFLRATRATPKSGGGGNRTRVPWHFGQRFYMRSLLIPDVLLVAFAAVGSGKRDPKAAIEQVF